MVRITQIKIPINGCNKKKRKNKENLPDLSDEICMLLKIKKDRLLNWKIIRRSIEARKKEALSYVYTVLVEVKNEAAILKQNNNKRITKAEVKKYRFPTGDEFRKTMRYRPVIAGSGPAGMMCGYFLAKYGYRPVILERGENIENRTESVKRFWDSGELNISSNVQFGEGGAGAFSDGKLNTGINDRYGRVEEVLRLFAENGAPSEIMYEAMPHVGTDKLFDVVRNLRKITESYGGEYRFNSCFNAIKENKGFIEGVYLSDGEFIPADVFVLAIGHSARDTMLMLHGSKIRMKAKSFAAGVRISHPQELINSVQWGDGYPESLGAAAYKLAVRLNDGRGAYTFCMCPGGYVVNASSEDKHLAVNGMSYSGRDSGYANSAVIVTLDPKDYLKYNNVFMPDELGAISFQRMLEKNAFNTASGAIPVQRFEDFIKGMPTRYSPLLPCTKGGWEFSDVSAVFPDFLKEGISEGIRKMGSKLKGFDMADALLYAAESRTSSPVRIERDDQTMQSNLKGLYPCGEGAGYAGGIISAAVDGIKTAEKIALTYKSYEQNSLIV